MPLTDPFYRDICNCVDEEKIDANEPLPDPPSAGVIVFVAVVVFSALTILLVTIL